MENSFERFVKRAILSLNDSGTDYVIIGGFAAIIYSRSRMTMDIDVIINVKPSESDKIKRLINSFEKKEFAVLESEVVASLKEKSHLSIFDKNSPFRIDIKGTFTKLDIIALKNKRPFEIFNLETWIEDPCDLIIAKLIYGSKQDIEDIVAVLLNFKDDLNFEYLYKRAKQENVYEKLQKLIDKLGF